MPPRIIRAKKPSKKKPAIKKPRVFKLPPAWHEASDIVQASTLGIVQEHLLAPVRLADLPSPGLKKADFSAQETTFAFEPLVAPRTSFWLGVGIGILITGVLGYITWQLYNVEIAEAVVLSLPQ